MIPERRLFRSGSSNDLYFEIDPAQLPDLLICRWIGYTDMEQVKEGSRLLLEEIRAHRFTNLLVDSREEEGPWNDSNRWILEVWLPEITNEGLRKTAIVVSDNIFSAMSAREHMETAREMGFNVRTFDSVPDALQWISRKKQTITL